VVDVVMKKSIIREKSFIFAIEIIHLFQYLQNNKKEFVLSKQLLKSESKPDFVHKLAIAQKECNETIYWLELLEQTNYIDKKLFIKICNEGMELLKILASIIKTLKSNKNS
jgi:four helix bundle protein